MTATTIRPFDWRDLALVYRVRDRGLCPDSQLAYTRGPHTLQNALLDIFTPGRSIVTLVARSDETDIPSAVGQLMLRNGRPTARLTFLGPLPAICEDSGMNLMESLVQAAGRIGAQNLVAEVDEQNPVFDCLREVGFAIYARQRIWKLSQTPHLDQRPLDTAWRFQQSVDDLPIQSLYLSMVPDLVKQVEPPPIRSPHNLVHWHQGELLGFLDVQRGPLGTWVQPYLHPAADEFDRLLAGFLRVSTASRWPLYVCIRSYHSWMGGSLDRLDFQAQSDQAVMVKRLAVGVREATTSPLPSLEGTYPETTSPISQIESSKPTSRAGGGL